MSDLDNLISAVEAGSIAPFYGEFQSALGATLRDDGVKAFDGDLNAAMRLHEALLPGWKWDVTVHAASVEAPSRTFSPMFPRDGIYDGHPCDTPARAWLLAILRAMRASQ